MRFVAICCTDFVIKSYPNKGLLKIIKKKLIATYRDWMLQPNSIYVTPSSLSMHLEGSNPRIAFSSHPFMMQSKSFSELLVLISSVNSATQEIIPSSFSCSLFSPLFYWFFSNIQYLSLFVYNFMFHLNSFKRNHK